jgi:hypothetical protein
VILLWLGVDALDERIIAIITMLLRLRDKKSPEETPGLLQSLVAGTGFEPVTFGL